MRRLQTRGFARRCAPFRPGSSVPLRPPEPLTDDHNLSGFECGAPALDEWLRRRARANQVAGASRTYVLCDGATVIGYYALAAGGVAVAGAPARMRRNMPDPIPVAILGRLAVAREHHGRGLGRALFRDAALRVEQAGEIIGIRGLLVDALSDEARGFYLALGLEPSPFDTMTLMATLTDIRQALG
jgi:GNAT superfamily N-acetyltransferase